MKPRLYYSLFFAAIVGCESQPTEFFQEHARTTSAPDATVAPPRNVILLIGDGMGPQQISMLKLFVERSASAKQSYPHSALIEMLEQGTRGIVFPWSHDGIVVDSACSTSQLATGVLCRSETLGVDERGAPVSSIAERARSAGKSVGLVTDTRITHATPAAFGAHQLHRSAENAVAVDLIESGFEVLLGGGMRHFIPADPDSAPAIRQLASAEPSARAMLRRSRRTDARNILTDAQGLGYQLVFDREQLAATQATKVLGLFAESGMANGIETHRLQNETERTEPSLAEMSLAALRLLERDPDGFFLMIEGGQIDWAAHHNDAGQLLLELLKFDSAVAAVRQWAAKREDTLTVLTADHETGSFGFSYSAHQIPEPEQIAETAFDKAPFQPRYNFVPPERLDQLFRQKATLFEIERQFSTLPQEQQTPATLRELISAATGITLPDHDLVDILTTAPNPYHKDGHDTLGMPIGPVLGDSAAFYPEVELNRVALIARKLSPYQGVVWGTGTHTSTPLFVVASGRQAQRFNGVFHTAELGRLLQAVFDVQESD